MSAQPPMVRVWRGGLHGWQLVPASEAPPQVERPHLDNPPPTERDWEQIRKDRAEDFGPRTT